MLEKIFRNYFAGSNQDDAIKKLNEFKELNIDCMVNYLGEHAKTDYQYNKNYAEYLTLINAVSDFPNGEISLKPSQLKEVQIESLVGHAERKGVFVWFDMEDYKIKDKILNLYLKLRKKYPNVGIALQAYLPETKDDIKRVLQVKGKIRLCKGAYSPKEAIRDKSIIREKMKEYFRKILEKRVPFALATHDKEILEWATEQEINFSTFEFQFLMGRHKEYVKELKAKGFKVKYYVPYGTHVYPYLIRRLKEMFLR